MADFLIDSSAANPKTVADIQQLLDSNAVHAGDAIVLKGTFSQNDDQFLRLSKSVTLRGDADAGATISGGRQLQWGRAPDGASIQPIAATIDNITFDNFQIGAIQIVGAVGSNVISNCHFENYRYGVKSTELKGAWPIVGGNAGVSGSLKITGCHFGAPAAQTVPAGGMNNALHINNCDLQQLVISDNVIDDMYLMCLAVWGVSGLTEIIGNTITKASSWTQSAGAAIGFGLRPSGYPMNRDGSVLIEGNTINIDAGDSSGIVVGLYPESTYLPASGAGAQRTLTIRGNVVHMRGAGGTGAKGHRAALACLGACSNSSWTHNVVAGSAQCGILVSQEAAAIAKPSAEAPTNNSFEENALAGGQLVDPTDGQTKQFEPFTASEAEIFIAEGVSHLALRANAIGPVSGANQWPKFQLPVHAGIACYGSDGEIASNDFSRSNIQGWIGGPTHVGCIFFAQSASGNRVEYSESEFPAGTLHPVSRQIFDEGHPGMKPEKDKNIVSEVVGAPG